MGVRNVDIGETYNGDIAARAVKGCRNIVDLGKICGAKSIERAAVVGACKLWNYATVSHSRERTDRTPHRFARKIVQRDDSTHHRRQRRGNLRVADVRLPLFAIHEKFVNVRMKRGPHLAYVSGEFDNVSSRRHADCREPSGRQPTCHGLNVHVGGAILRAELLRSQPLVKIGRFIAHLLGHELLQRGFLFRAPLQQKQHAVHGRGIGHCALVELRAGERVHVAFEAHQLCFVNGLRDAGRHGGSLDK
jgi:hypothetical protein